MSEPKLATKVRSHILDIGGLLSEEPKDPRFEFAFKFLYPSQRGRNIVIIKLKKKKFVEFSQGINFSVEHQKLFMGLSEIDKRNFLNNLQNIPLAKELETVFNIGQKITVVLIDKFFLGENLTLNKFYEKVKRLFNSSVLLTNFVQKRLAGEVKMDDYGSAKIDHSLYS